MLTQSCPTLCNLMDCSLDFPGKNAGLPFPSPGDLSSLETEPTSPALAGGFFTTEPPGKPQVTKLPSLCLLSCFSPIQLFAVLRTVTYQTSLSMGFSRQEYWSVLPCLAPGYLPNTGIKPTSPALQTDSLPPVPPGEPPEKAAV